MARTFIHRLLSGESDDDPAAVNAYNEMTRVFLETDRLLAEIDEGVAAARDSGSNRQVVPQWGLVRDRHAEVTAAYLQLQRPTFDSPYAVANAYEACTQALRSVSAEMVAFRVRFRESLARARAARQLATQAEQQARVAADQAVATLELPQSLPFLQYPSVVAAVDELSARIRGLDSVTDIAERRAASSAVSEAASAVRSAVVSARQREGEAQTAVRSISTRISAVSNRAEQLGPTRSALFREFSAACSDDLADNDRLAAEAAAAAERELQDARDEIEAGRPEIALKRCAQAREHLTDADKAVDAVTTRLRLLREVREDPSAIANSVRFRLRDAQRLAVQRDLVAEWGSALDAQIDRIDRSCAAIGRVPPDYWTYVNDLETIDRFIVGVVDRMRGRG